MIGNDCYCCKKQCQTPNSDYYPIYLIRYCRPQVFFIIEHLEQIGDGKYPADPKPSGYVDSNIQHQINQEAGFVNAAIVYAEVTARLDMCRGDGVTLVHEIVNLHAEYYDMLSPAARNALNYCSGWARKRKRYSAWVARRRQDAGVKYIPLLRK
jgi:hypothetical protein